MAAGRREFEGELVAWLVRCVPGAVWSPGDLPAELNPFREAAGLSEAMRAHLEGWERRRWRAAVDNARG